MLPNPVLLGMIKASLEKIKTMSRYCREKTLKTNGYANIIGFIKETFKNIRKNMNVSEQTSEQEYIYIYNGHEINKIFIVSRNLMREHLLL